MAGYAFCVTCEYLPGPQRCPAALVPICVLYDCNSLFFLGEALLISIHTHILSSSYGPIWIAYCMQEKMFRNYVILSKVALNPWFSAGSGK